MANCCSTSLSFILQFFTTCHSILFCTDPIPPARDRPEIISIPLTPAVAYLSASVEFCPYYKSTDNDTPPALHLSMTSKIITGYN